MAKKQKIDPSRLGMELKDKVSPFAWLRARFFAGIIIAAPIAISVSIVLWLITLIDNRVKPLLPPILKPETYTNIAIPGVGVLVAIILLTLLGTIGTNLIGRSVLSYSDRFLSRVPVVSNLYVGLKQLFEIFGSNQEDSFKEVVLVEYPRKGTWAVGFLTVGARGEIASRLGEGYKGVFVPTTPNPTSGFIMFYHESDIRPLDMSVEEGAKLIFTAGLVVPDFIDEADRALLADGADAPDTEAKS